MIGVQLSLSSSKYMHMSFSFFIIRSLTEQERRSRRQKEEFFSLSQVVLKANGQLRDDPDPRPWPRLRLSRDRGHHYDSNGPNDERYYVPYDQGQEEVPERVASPSKRRINRQRHKQRPQTEFHGHFCHQRADQPAPISLLSLFSKSTSALMADQKRPNFVLGSRKGTTPVPDYSPPMPFRSHDGWKVSG